MHSNFPLKTTDTRERWSKRRIALVRELDIRPKSVNRSWCPKISKGVRAGTEGGDLRRLVREGFAELEHKGGPRQQARLLFSGERSLQKQGSNEAKRVVLTRKGRELLAQHNPAVPRQANPWARRRKALVEAGLAKASVEPAEPAEPRPKKGWGW